MANISLKPALRSFNGPLARRLACFLAILLVGFGASASENGGSVYPIGVETVMPGMLPPPGKTMFFEFSTFYTANQLDNSFGKSAAPEFKLRVEANAIRFVHNWGVPVFGGMLNSNIAVPQLYEQLHVAPGLFTGAGLGNVDIGVAQLGYNHGPWHWYYEGDVFLPGAPYSKTAVLNIGQHNYAAAPVTAFTYLPNHERTELSSKFMYIVNFKDPATSYLGGNQFIWEYDAMQQVSRKIALGANGYLSLQTTDDRQFGAVVGDGNRDRDFDIGPEVRISLPGHSAFALKYIADTMVENQPRGNAFWFQIGIPIGFGRSEK